MGLIGMVRRRPVKYVTVGLSGVLVNEGLLYFLTEILGVFYLYSSLVAIEISIITNFLFNDAWTFSDRVKEGSSKAKRLLKFNLVSVAGMAINITALYIFTSLFSVYYLYSNIIAIVIAFGWNFIINNLWTWKPHAKA